MKQTVEHTQSYDTQNNDLDSRAATAARLSSLAIEHTAVAVEQTPILDSFKLHRQIISDIDKISGWEGTLSSEEIDEARNSIADNALDLAARLLPEDVRNEYALTSYIRDNDGVDHPPTKKEIILLGTAWDVTRNDKSGKTSQKSEILGHSVAAAIEELSDESERKFLQRVLRESKKKENDAENIGFNTAYVRAEADRLETNETFELDNQLKPMTFMAFTEENIPLEESFLDPLDEQNEQLAVIVPTHFPPEGASIEDTLPRVHYPTAH